MTSEVSDVGAAATVSPRMTLPGQRAKTRKKRERRPLEATEFAAMMRRMLAAHGRRVADADMEDLAELIALGDELEAVIAKTVRDARERHGWSWADIGRAAGIERQSAHKKWGTPPCV